MSLGENPRGWNGEREAFMAKKARLSSHGETGFTSMLSRVSPPWKANG